MAKRRDFFELYELIEQTGFLFNPVITYTGSFLLKTGSFDGGLTYERDKDVFVLNSRVVDGKNKYEEFCNKHFVSNFGNPPANAIMPAITPLLVSEMNADGHGRTVKFSYTPTLLILLEDASLITDAPDDEAELALYVAQQVKVKRDKMFNVLRLWDKSPYYEELRDRYESHGYMMSYEFLEKQNNYFTKLLRLLKYDIKSKIETQTFAQEEFVECFDKDKMILMLCKCIVDNCKNTAANEKVFHNCMVEVLQLIQNVKELGLDKEFNPCIKLYDDVKKKYVMYTFADLKKEVAQMLSEHPEFEIATVTMEDVVSRNLVRNASATEEFGKILDVTKRNRLAANWTFVRSGEREAGVPTETPDFDAQMKKRTTIGTHEKDAYLELMRKRLFFEKTGYMEQILGVNSFAGYVGYIYANGMVIFEKMYDDETRTVPAKDSNATYVMNIDNFVELSSLSKSDIIKYIKNTVNPNVKRVYHSKNWEQRLLSIIEGTGYDAVEEKIDSLIETGRVRREGKDLGTGKGKK